MIELKDNYQDDVLDSEKNQLRKYNMIHNDDGTVSFVDATVYSQNGDNFGAKDVNDIVARIGEVSKAENIAYDNEKSVQGAIDELKGTIGYSKKNLLKNEATTQTITGVTFTVNSDNSVTVNGTNTGSGNVKFKIGTFTYKANEKYILNGCPTGGSVESGYCIQSEDTVSHHDVGEGIEISYDNEKANYIYIRVTSGATVNNVTFYPMLRYASIQDDTYEPYVADLKSLVCNVEKIRVNQVFTSSTTGIECWSYTAKRRCLLNVTVTFGNYSGKATDVKAYISGVDGAVVNHRNTGDGQSHLVMPISVCLEKGEKLTTYSTYNNATQNRYIVEGYVQYLE